MFSVAYLLFLWLGYIQVPFDFGMLCFFVVADALSVPVYRFGNWVYVKLKKKVFERKVKTNGM